MKRIVLIIFLLAMAPVQARTVGADRVHAVRKGQSLLKIALHYGLSASQVAQANGLNAPLREGQRLNIPNRRILPFDAPRDGIVVNLPERGLYLFRGGAFRQFYPVAIGTGGRFGTPVGSFKITNLVKDPQWFPPEWADRTETVVPPGPDNPLGDRWIGLSEPGLGLHATADRTSVGTPASHGCMRMIPEHVGDLFGQVKKGMPVKIVYRPVEFESDAGGISMVSFPDVYHHDNNLGTARRLLAASGLRDFVPDDRLRRLVRRADGVVRPLVYAPRVEIDGRAAGLDAPVLRRGGRLWVPLQLAQQLGHSVQWNAATRKAKVDGQPLPKSSIALGRAYVPARDLLGALGARHELAGGVLRIYQKPK